MSFGHPWLLLTLLVLPALVYLYVRVRYAVRYTNLDVLASVAGERAWFRFAAPILLLLALAVLCAGVARPRHRTTVAREEAAVILVLDVSGSMEAKDIKPTRLRAAQQAMNGFLDRVPKKLRVGLILFAGEAQVATPPTTNHDLVRESLAGADNFSGFRGTAIGDALEEAVTVARAAISKNLEAQPQTIAFTAAPVTDSPVSILFLSDGHQTRGALQPLEGAQLAKQAGVPVYTVSLGTANGKLDPSNFGFPRGTDPRLFGNMFNVAPDPKTLRQIAEVTGGKFFNARSQDSLRTAYSSLGSHLGRVQARKELTSDFVLVAALLLVGAGIASRFWVPRLP
jgi:Ca-activated chloride channel family protein